MTNVLMIIGGRAITPEWAKGPIQCIEGCETAARENRVVEVEFDF